MEKLRHVLLVDDDPDSNFFHERTLRKSNCVEEIHIASDGADALNFLKDPSKPRPDIIFLDINMPGMDGWSFLDAYAQLDDDVKGHIVVIMLTTSLNPDDQQRAITNNHVDEFANKYLEIQDLKSIVGKHFPDVCK